MFEGDDALKKIKILSGGEKSRVLLGRVIANKANLLALGARDSAAKGSVQMAEMIMAMEEITPQEFTLKEYLREILIPMTSF